MYKIIDTQGGGLMAGEVFKTKKDVIARLGSFHDSDFSGVKDDDTEYKDIFEMLNTMPEEEQLTFLLEHGQWDLEYFESLFDFDIFLSLQRGNDMPLRVSVNKMINAVFLKSERGEIGWGDCFDSIDEIIKEGREVAKEYYPKN